MSKRKKITRDNKVEKIYICKDGIYQLFFMLVCVVLLLIGLMIYFTYYFEFELEYFIPVFIIIWYMAMFICFGLTTLPAASYLIIDIDKNVVKMYSFFGKEISSINIDSQSEVYYEVIRVREDIMIFRDYLIVSNMEFDLYSKEKKNGIFYILNKVIKSKNQIMISKKYGYEILNLCNYDKISGSVH